MIILPPSNEFMDIDNYHQTMIIKGLLTSQKQPDIFCPLVESQDFEVFLKNKQTWIQYRCQQPVSIQFQFLGLNLYVLSNKAGTTTYSWLCEYKLIITK